MDIKAKEIIDSNLTASQKEKLATKDYIRLVQMACFIFAVLSAAGIPESIKNKIAQRRIHKEMKKELKLLIGD